MPERIILDTDIGTDVDDAMAVALAALSPELQVEGITTVYGDVDLRARMVVKILKLLGREDIPVMAGVRDVLLRNRPIWWLGHEGEGLLEQGDEALTYDKRHAVDFIIETVMNNPGEITLIAIGPFTNIAIALAREPRVADYVKQIIIMGGSTRLGGNGAELEPVDHNLSRDPESGALLFASGAPIVMCGYDVTRQVLVGWPEIAQLEATGDRLNLAMARMMRRWFDYWKRDFTAMNDPLCVALAFDSTLCSGKKMNVTVEYDHRHPTGHVICTLPRTPWTPPEELEKKPEEPKVQVCLEVDAQRFVTLMMNRVCDK
ncbi:MAG: nucleoside hydrolase [Angelakisella sp.]|nr:nucleoside hydrolase [Angelakisella sp.]